MVIVTLVSHISSDLYLSEEKKILNHNFIPGLSFTNKQQQQNQNKKINKFYNDVYL